MVNTKPSDGMLEKIGASVSKKSNKKIDKKKNKSGSRLMQIMTKK
jgi:hypothetical protein